MSEQPDTGQSKDQHANRPRGQGDDEQENREHIEQTGEPNRDELGNADGAS